MPRPDWAKLHADFRRDLDAERAAEEFDRRLTDWRIESDRQSAADSEALFYAWGRSEPFKRGGLGAPATTRRVLPVMHMSGWMWRALSDDNRAAITGAGVHVAVEQDPLPPVGRANAPVWAWLLSPVLLPVTLALGLVALVAWGPWGSVCLCKDLAAGVA